MMQSTVDAAVSRNPAAPSRSVALFLAIAFIAVIALCAPAILGVDADYLVVMTPFAQWIPAVAVVIALRVSGVSLRWREAWALQPFGGRRTAEALALVTIAIVAVAAAQIAVSVSAGVVEWSPAPDVGSIALWVLPVAILALLSATGEEAGWRGFLWTGLRERRGFWATAFIVGVIWAAWHLPLLAAYGLQGDLPWRNVIATTIDLIMASFVLGAGRELSRSAWPAAWGHALVNSVLVFTSTNFVTPDRALADPEFWTYRAIGWGLWLVAALGVLFWRRNERAPSNPEP